MPENKILLASASGADRQLVSNTLEDESVNIIEATNGIEAYDMIIEHGNEIILAFVNCELPIRDGMTLVNILKRSSKFSHVPLVMLVHSDNPEVLEKVEKSWADAFLKRPLDDFDINRTFQKYALEEPLAMIEEEN